MSGSGHHACVVCRGNPADTGALCAACAARLGVAERLCPEQLEAHVPPGTETGAALVDRWGQLHPVADRTVIGRGDERTQLQIRHAGVSRLHSQIWTGDAGKTWSVRDLGSSAGTELNGKLLMTKARVSGGDIVKVADVGLYFVEEVRAARPRRPTGSIPTLIPPKDVLAEALAPAPATLVVYEAGPSGRGTVEVGGKSVRLPGRQLQLVALLERRLREDVDAPDTTRGFVRSSEIIASLDWESDAPDENHLKQLVRRVRQAFEDQQMADPIESRAGFGYRLCLAALGRHGAIGS